MGALQIQSVQFEPDSIVVTFLDPDEVRVGGKVLLARQMILDRDHPDYGEDAELLHRQAERMVRNALEDWEHSEPVRPEDDEEYAEYDEMGAR